MEPTSGGTDVCVYAVSAAQILRAVFPHSGPDYDGLPRQPWPQITTLPDIDVVDDIDFSHRHRMTAHLRLPGMNWPMPNTPGAPFCAAPSEN